MNEPRACCALVTVLQGTFEWRELSNLVADAGVVGPAVRRPEDDDAAAEERERRLGRLALRSAMALFSQSRAFRRLLGHRLGRLHAETVSIVREGTADELVDHLGKERGTLTDPSRRAGWVWALVSDGRPEVRDLARAILAPAPARPRTEGDRQSL